MRRHAGRTERTPEIAPRAGGVSCGGKRQFASFADGDKVARSMRRHLDEAMTTYRCLRCRKWHLGHSL